MQHINSVANQPRGSAPVSVQCVCVCKCVVAFFFFSLHLQIKCIPNSVFFVVVFFNPTVLRGVTTDTQQLCTRRCHVARADHAHSRAELLSTEGCQARVPEDGTLSSSRRKDAHAHLHIFYTISYTHTFCKKGL